MYTLLRCIPALVMLTALFAIVAYQVRRLNRMNEEQSRRWRESHQKGE